MFIVNHPPMVAIHRYRKAIVEWSGGVRAVCRGVTKV
jgi:hypothetical protein